MEKRPRNPISINQVNGQTSMFDDQPVATKVQPSSKTKLKNQLLSNPRTVEIPEIGADQIEELKDLIMAQYDMGRYERRIFIKMLEMLPESVQEPISGAEDMVAMFKPIEVDAREIIADSDLKGESAFEELKKATKNLIKHVCHIAESDGMLQVGLMSSAKYRKGKGKISILVDPRLHPYLRKVRTHFTLEALRELIKFRSYYTQCFYEWFSKVSISRKTPGIYISLDALRTMLAIEETEYERYYDFKRFVIGQAQKELKGSQFEFEYKERRSGRTVVGHWFYLVWNNYSQNAN